MNVNEEFLRNAQAQYNELMTRHTMLLRCAKDVIDAYKMGGEGGGLRWAIGNLYVAMTAQKIPGAVWGALRAGDPSGLEGEALAIYHAMRSEPNPDAEGDKP